jgi:hypothetical protein
MQGNNLTLRIGNEYEYLTDPARIGLSKDGIKKPHQFTLFVRVVHGDEKLIRGVLFTLHETFEPREFLKKSPQTVVDGRTSFQTVQTCYGAFRAFIEVQWYGKKSDRFTWDIKFEQGKFMERKVKSGVEGTLRDVSVPNLTFGVELEMTLPSSMHSTETVADFLNNRGHNVRACGYVKEVTEYWKIVPDSSIACGLSDPNCLRCEFVSPILRGRAGLDEIARLLGSLADLNVKVNKSAGMHVHIGSKGLSLNQLKKISAQFVKYEMAFDSLVPESRRGVNNRYLQSHLYQFGLQSNKQINEAIMTRRKQKGLLLMMNGSRGDDRYFKLNMQRLKGKSPTIEFRQHSGTSDNAKVQAWILLLLHFVRNR